MDICMNENVLEVGCDESGAGSGAGRLYIGCVMFPSQLPDRILESWEYKMINDSKKVNEKNRYLLEDFIKDLAIDYSVVYIEPEEIDEINIRQARIKGFHKAIDNLNIKPEHILVDGDAYRSHKRIPFTLVKKGDTLYKNIAAASILAKCAHDTHINKIHKEFPMYNWDSNHGYLTKGHLNALKEHGACKYHRISWNLHL